MYCTYTMFMKTKARSNFQFSFPRKMLNMRLLQITISAIYENCILIDTYISVSEISWVF